MMSLYVEPVARTPRREFGPSCILSSPSLKSDVCPDLWHLYIVCTKQTATEYHKDGGHASKPIAVGPFLCIIHLIGRSWGPRQGVNLFDDTTIFRPFRNYHSIEAASLNNLEAIYFVYSVGYGSYYRKQELCISGSPRKDGLEHFLW